MIPQDMPDWNTLDFGRFSSSASIVTFGILTSCYYHLHTTTTTTTIKRKRIRKKKKKTGFYIVFFVNLKFIVVNIKINMRFFL